MMKYEFINEQYCQLAEELQKKNVAMKEMEKDVSEMRDQEAYEKRELNQVLVEVERKEKHLDDLREQVEQKKEDVKSNEALNDRLRKEIESLKKRIEFEGRIETDRKVELESIRKKEREAFHKLQEVKANVRVCVRIRPAEEAHQGDFRGAAEAIKKPEDTMLEFDDSANQIKLNMPKSVSFAHQGNKIKQFTSFSNV